MRRRSELYREYKESGGTLSLNAFQKFNAIREKEAKNDRMQSEDGLFAEPM